MEEFNTAIASILSSTVSATENKCVINVTIIETPLGSMYACATQKGICLLEFCDHKFLEKHFNSLSKLFAAEISIGPNKHFDILQSELKEYFDGNRKIFTVPLDTPGTAFQQLVWNALMNIPYGQIKTYKEQATAINNLPAIRAVANANGLNRIPIIIPCHRVIGTNGSLTGYGSGLNRKRWLLELERNNSEQKHKTTLF